MKGVHGHPSVEQPMDDTKQVAVEAELRQTSGGEELPVVGRPADWDGPGSGAEDTTWIRIGGQVSEEEGQLTVGEQSSSSKGQTEPGLGQERDKRAGRYRKSASCAKDAGRTAD